MPIYEYQCRQCGERSEALQRMADPPLSECGECGGELRKLVSAPAFQFKGTGWYVTDYAKKDKGKDSAESEGDGGSKSGGDSGSDGQKTESGGEGASKSSSESSAKKEPSSSASEPKAKESSAS